MKTIIIILGLSTLLFGCTQLSPVGQAYRNSTDCMAEISKDPHVQRIDKEVIPDSNASPELRYTLLNSTDRIKEDQKLSMGIYIMLSQQCQSQFVIALSGTPLMEPWKKFFARKNSQMNLLLKGDITVGEFNTAFSADSKQFALELQNIYGVMRGQNAIDQINATRMFGNSTPLYTAPAPAYKGITTMGEPPPAYVPPIQTICQPNGVGGFNCSSR